MPIGFDPNDTADVRLHSVDGDRPDDQRATFTCRFLTAGHVKRLDALRRRAVRLSDAAADAMLNDGIRQVVVGWRNLRDHAGRAVDFQPPPAPAAPPPDDPAAEYPDPPYDVLDEFTAKQKLEMLAEIPFRLLLSDHEKKASPSPSPAT